MRDSGIRFDTTTMYLGVVNDTIKMDFGITGFKFSNITFLYLILICPRFRANFLSLFRGDAVNVF